MNLDGLRTVPYTWSLQTFSIGERGYRFESDQGDSSLWKSMGYKTALSYLNRFYALKVLMAAHDLGKIEELGSIPTKSF